MYGIDSSWIFALLSLVIGTEEEIAGLDSDLGGEGKPSISWEPSLFLGNSRDFAGVVPKTLARDAAICMEGGTASWHAAGPIYHRCR